MKQQEYTDAEVDIFIENVKNADFPDEKKARFIDLYEQLRPEKKTQSAATPEEARQLLNRMNVPGVEKLDRTESAKPTQETSQLLKRITPWMQ